MPTIPSHLLNRSLCTMTAPYAPARACACSCVSDEHPVCSGIMRDSHACACYKPGSCRRELQEPPRKCHVAKVNRQVIDRMMTSERWTRGGGGRVRSANGIQLEMSKAWARYVSADYLNMGFPHVECIGSVYLGMDRFALMSQSK